MYKHIFITGATGTIGSEIVRKLIAEGVDFKAGVREPGSEKTEFIPANAQVHFDFEDPKTFEKALDGAESVFLLGPPLYPDLYALLKPFVDYLKDSEVKKVVYLSALGMEEIEGMDFHQRIVQDLDNMEVALTVLQPSFFSSNFKNYEAENILERGVTFVPAGNRKVAFVDPRDIAAVAYQALINEKTNGKTYQITGGQTMTYHQAAEVLTQKLGKTVVYPEPTPEVYRDTLKEAQVPEFVADYMIPVYGLIRDSKVDLVTETVKEVAGKNPYTLDESIEYYFGLN
jgi:uncharacterized protein YbjT (DUF2867 family)